MLIELALLARHPGLCRRWILEDSYDLDPLIARLLLEQNRLLHYLEKAYTMPEFDNRRNDPSKENLSGEDIGPKAEGSPPSMADRGEQGSSNEKEGEQSLGDLNAPSEGEQMRADARREIHDSASKTQEISSTERDEICGYDQSPDHPSETVNQQKSGSQPEQAGTSSMNQSTAERDEICGYEQSTDAGNQQAVENSQSQSVGASQEVSNSTDAPSHGK